MVWWLALSRKSRKHGDEDPRVLETGIGNGETAFMIFLGMARAVMRSATALMLVAASPVGCGRSTTETGRKQDAPTLPRVATAGLDVTAPAVRPEDYLADPPLPEMIKSPELWGQTTQASAARRALNADPPNLAEALERGLKAGLRTNDPEAWQIAGFAACRLKDKRSVSQVLFHVADRGSRIAIERACSQSGITIQLDAADEKVQEIQRAFEGGRYADVERDSRALLSKNAKDIELWILLGRAACAIKDTETALLARKRAWELRTDSGDTSVQHIDYVCRTRGITLH